VQSRRGERVRATDRRPPASTSGAVLRESGPPRVKENRKPVP
jgi:hypothetical protein